MPADEARWLRALNLHAFDFFAEPRPTESMDPETVERVQACAAQLTHLTLNIEVETYRRTTDGFLTLVETRVRAQLPKLEERRILHIEVKRRQTT